MAFLPHQQLLWKGIFLALFLLLSFLCLLLDEPPPYPLLLAGACPSSRPSSVATSPCPQALPVWSCGCQLLEHRQPLSSNVSSPPSACALSPALAGSHVGGDTEDLAHPGNGPCTVGQEGQWIKALASPGTRQTVPRCLGSSDVPGELGPSCP